MCIRDRSEGALVIPVARETDKKEMPPLILLKSDGAVLYGTTDLATVIDRVGEQNPDLILYVVDHRQHAHFEQVFRAAEKANLNGHAVLEHVGYGTMNGPDGKPFKTRAGGVMKLYDLIAMATDEAQKRLTEQGLGADYSDDERGEIARKVGIATIKFADLSNHRQTDYTVSYTHLDVYKRQPQWPCRARTCRLRNDERPGRQTVQDARGRRDETLRSHRDGHG